MKQHQAKAKPLVRRATSPEERRAPATGAQQHALGNARIGAAPASVMGAAGDARTKLPDDDALKILHGALDIAGLIPLLGAVPDALNAGIYCIEGDWANAGLSAAAMIPIFGEGVTVTKLGVRVTQKAVKRTGKEAIELGIKAARKETTTATKLLGQGLRRFTGDEAVEHFKRHGSSVMAAFGKSSYNVAEYIADANHVIHTGQWVSELNAYVKIIGGKGSAKVAFVGVTRSAKEAITTFHIKTVAELAKKAPSLGWIP